MINWNTGELVSVIPQGQLVLVEYQHSAKRGSDFELVRFFDEGGTLWIEFPDCSMEANQFVIYRWALVK